MVDLWRVPDFFQIRVSIWKPYFPLGIDEKYLSLLMKQEENGIFQAWFRRLLRSGDSQVAAIIYIHPTDLVAMYVLYTLD